MTKAYTTYGSKVYHMSRACCDNRTQGTSANGIRATVTETTVERAEAKGLRCCLKCSTDKPVVNTDAKKIAKEVRRLNEKIAEAEQMAAEWSESVEDPKLGEWSKKMVAKFTADAEALKARRDQLAK